MRSLLFLCMFAAGVWQIMSAVTLVFQFHQLRVGGNTMPLSLNLCFATVTVEETLVILVLYGFVGDIYNESKKSLRDLKRKIVGGPNQGIILTRKEQNYRKMYIASCQIEKFQFELSNYIEKKTVPVFQIFCCNRIIDILFIK